MYIWMIPFLRKWKSVNAKQLSDINQFCEGTLLEKRQQFHTRT